MLKIAQASGAIHLFQESFSFWDLELLPASYLDLESSIPLCYNYTSALSTLMALNNAPC